MKNGILIAGSCLLASTMSFGLENGANKNSDNYQIHILKQGETLSELLLDNNYRPLYGKTNWVAKTLEINHLTQDQALKIKKGYPVILPKRFVQQLAKADKVKIGQASTSRYGLIGNKISNHQDLFINMGYHQNSANYSNTSIKMRENFTLAVKAVDKNSYKIGQFSYKPEGHISITSHGTTEFSNQNTKATFRPSWEVQSTHMLSKNSNNFSFGPYAKAHNSSQVEFDGTTYGVRRDRFISLGMKANQKYEVGFLDMNLSASMNSSVISEALTSYDNMSIIQSEIAFDINLTRTYFVGTYWKTQTASNSDQTSSDSVGFKLSYFLK